MWPCSDPLAALQQGRPQPGPQHAPPHRPAHTPGRMAAHRPAQAVPGPAPPPQAYAQPPRPPGGQAAPPGAVFGQQHPPGFGPAGLFPRPPPLAPGVMPPPWPVRVPHRPGPAPPDFSTQAAGEQLPLLWLQTSRNGREHTRGLPGPRACMRLWVLAALLAASPLSLFQMVQMRPPRPVAASADVPCGPCRQRRFSGQGPGEREAWWQRIWQRSWPGPRGPRVSSYGARGGWSSIAWMWGGKVLRAACNVRVCPPAYLGS